MRERASDVGDQIKRIARSDNVISTTTLPGGDKLAS
jgi:hypothetical protein